jgi:hypothetical protein
MRKFAQLVALASAIGFGCSNGQNTVYQPTETQTTLLAKTTSGSNVSVELRFTDVDLEYHGSKRRVEITSLYQPEAGLFFWAAGQVVFPQKQHVHDPEGFKKQIQVFLTPGAITYFVAGGNEVAAGESTERYRSFEEAMQNAKRRIGTLDANGLGAIYTPIHKCDVLPMLGRSFFNRADRDARPDHGLSLDDIRKTAGGWQMDVANADHSNRATITLGKDFKPIAAKIHGQAH